MARAYQYFSRDFGVKSAKAYNGYASNYFCGLAFFFLHRPGKQCDGKRFTCDGKRNKLQLNRGQMFCGFAMFLKSLFFV